MGKIGKMTKEEKSWIFYDWANSAYSIAITTAILPLFFKMMTDQAGLPGNVSTAFWGYTNAIATTMVSVLAPILGTIADYRDKKKRFFTFFFGLGVVFTCLLAIVPLGRWQILLGFYILTVVGFSGANIFYDSFLVDISEGERMDKVSTYGFGFGYIGSTIPFIISILIIAVHGKIGIPETVAYQLSFVITALWWGLFTIPMLRHVNQVHCIEPEAEPIKKSFIRLGETLKNIKQYRYVFIFLIAYFFYIDGVGTIIKMAGVFGADVGIGSTDLLIILLATQFVAFPFALLYGKLAERFSGKRMIEIAILIYIFICFFARHIDSTLDYWILAMLVASSQGGIQALSRSYFGKLIPRHRSNEFFGFYNIFGKFAAIMGPILMGAVSQLTGDSRNGVLSIMILFVIGGILLIRIPQEAKKQI